MQASEQAYGYTIIEDELPMVIVVPSYKNARWCEDNLRSIYGQEYNNYRVIYISDCSPDNQVEVAREFIQKHDQEHRTIIINNPTRRGAMSNLYNAIHSCNGKSIIVTVDGDDFLAHTKVLTRLNDVYKNEDVWLTYGQFIEWPKKSIGFCKDFATKVIAKGTYRTGDLPVSHLRTFRAWLFQQISLEDFIYKGAFYTMTWDRAMVGPMLEMADGNYKFIDEILYIYNFDNPINDCKVNEALQMKLAHSIRWQKKYKSLKAPTIVEDQVQRASIDVILLVESVTQVKTVVTSELLSNTRINTIYLLSHTDVSSITLPSNKVVVVDSLESFKKQIQSSTAQYLLFLNEQNVITNAQLEQATHALVTTKAFCFNFTITKAILDQSQTPYFVVNNYFGWQLSSSKNNSLLELTGNALCEKKSILNDLKSGDIHQASLLRDIIDAHLIDSHLICLCN